MMSQTIPAVAACLSFLLAMFTFNSLPWLSEQVDDAHTVGNIRSKRPASNPSADRTHGSGNSETTFAVPKPRSQKASSQNDSTVQHDEPTK